MTSVAAPPKPPFPSGAQRGPAGSARLRPDRAAAGRLTTVHLVGLEIAAVAVGLALVAGTLPAAVLGVAVAACVLGLVFARTAGRWGYQLAGAWFALRARRRGQRAAAAGPGRGQPATGTLLAGLRVYGLADRGGEIGVGRDERGWFAAVAVHGGDDVLGGQPQVVRVDQLLRVLDEGTARPSAVQLVTLRVSAPTSLLNPRSACLESFRELVGQLPDRQPAPAAQLTWIAVRLDGGDALAAAAERGGGVEGVNRTLAATVRRIEKLLGGSGVACRVLGAADLAEALRLSCGTGTASGTGNTTYAAGNARPAAGEEWRGWQADGVRHAAFHVVGWPAELDGQLLDRVAAASAAPVVVSVTMRGRGASVGIRAVVRVMAPPGRLDAVAAAVVEQAARLEVDLRPLHGVHGPAVYASAPTGGALL